MKYILPIIFAVVLILSAGCVQNGIQQETVIDNTVYYDWINTNDNLSVLAHYGDGVANEHPKVSRWIQNHHSEINSEIKKWSDDSGFVTKWFGDQDLYLTVMIYGRTNNGTVSEIPVADLSEIPEMLFMPAVLIRVTTPDFTLPPQKIHPTESEKEKMDALYESISEKAKGDGLIKFPMKFITVND